MEKKKKRNRSIHTELDQIFRLQILKLIFCHVLIYRDNSDG